MTDAQIINTLIEYSDKLELFSIPSYFIRWLGWWIIKLLASLVDGLEKAVTKIYSFINFFDYPEISKLISFMKPLIWFSLALALTYLGYQLMFNKKVDREQVVPNIVMAIAVILLLPTFMTKFSSLTQIAINGVNTEYSSTAYTIVKGNVNDVYLYDSNGFNSHENRIKDKNIKSIDITEKIDPDKTKNKDLFKNKVLYDNNGKAYLEKLDNAWFVDFFDEQYYRWDWNFWTMFFTLGVTAFTLSMVCFKVARLIYELAFNKVFSSLLAFTDITSGQRLKKLITNIFSTFAVLFLMAIMIKIYMLGSIWIGNKTTGIVSIFLLAGFSIGVIDGPNMVEQLLGIDAGLSSMIRNVASMYYAGKSISAAGGALGKAAKGISGLGVKGAAVAAGAGLGAMASNKAKKNSLENDMNNSTNKNNDIDNNVKQEKNSNDTLENAMNSKENNDEIPQNSSESNGRLENAMNEVQDNNISDIDDSAIEGIETSLEDGMIQNDSNVNDSEGIPSLYNDMNDSSIKGSETSLEDGMIQNDSNVNDSEGIPSLYDDMNDSSIKGSETSLEGAMIQNDSNINDSERIPNLYDDMNNNVVENGVALGSNIPQKNTDNSNSNVTTSSLEGEMSTQNYSSPQAINNLHDDMNFNETNSISESSLGSSNQVINGVSNGSLEGEMNKENTRVSDQHKTLDSEPLNQSMNIDSASKKENSNINAKGINISSNESSLNKQMDSKNVSFNNSASKKVDQQGNISKDVLNSGEVNNVNSGSKKHSVETRTIQHFVKDKFMNKPIIKAGKKSYDLTRNTLDNWNIKRAEKGNTDKGEND